MSAQDIIMAAAGVGGGYEISRSLRFNSADSAYLNRTPASAGSRTTWTWSAWVKRSSLSAYNFLFNAVSGNSETEIIFTNNDTLQFLVYNSGATAGDLNTTQVFRDVSAWYHICVAYDSTNATSGERMRMYVNGSRVTVFSSQTYPTQNTQGLINSTISHTLGAYTPTQFFVNGYMTEVNFIDGQALTPSSFGETNAQTGVWQPKAYSGSYGTNGFYLNFSDNSNTTAATLGKDYSGNGNNWTPNNFSVTAGAGNDSLVDSPTSYGTDTGVGGTVRGNYCTLNPISGMMATASWQGVQNGNLTFVPGTTNWVTNNSTFAVSSGKWYWEVSGTTANEQQHGIVKIPTVTLSGTGSFLSLYPDSYSYYSGNGNKYTFSANSAYGASYTTNDVIGVALDMDAGTLTFYKNGVSQGVAFTGLSGTFSPAFAANGTSSGITVNVNFGQRPFAYTAPSGYKALCTQNLPTPTIGATTATQAGKYFNPVLYTGNGSTQSITGVGFQPDFTWIKVRSTTYDHQLVDAVRGSGKVIHSNLTNAEATLNTVTSFNSDGFTVDATTYIGTNASGGSFVAWNWKANGSGSTNTSGSITSTVSANTTSGFSVVAYTGNGNLSPTIGHGLGKAPSVVLIKPRSGTGNWIYSYNDNGNDTAMWLNSTNAAGLTTVNDGWCPISSGTSTTFALSTFTTINAVNASGTTYVAYCFAEVAGYSKFGSYTGNGSTDGVFIYTGFRPAYVLIKTTSTANDWCVYDTARNTYNATTLALYPNGSYAEGSLAGIDILSNGFKLRNTTQLNNQSGVNYIFAAFASTPFKYALAR